MSGLPWLDEPAEWSGYWWLPEDPEDRHPGVLRWEPREGLTLSLIGGFQDALWEPTGMGAFRFKGESQGWDVLFGVANGRPVTLLDSFMVSSKSFLFHFDGPDQQQVRAQTALVGAHLRGKDENVFSGCRAGIEDLTTWAAEPVLSNQVEAPGARRSGAVSLTATPREGAAVFVGGTTLRLRHRQKISLFERRRGSTLASISHAVELGIEPDEAASLTQLRDLVNAMQDLVSLGIHRPAGLLWLTLTMPSEAGAHREGLPPRPREVKMYAQHIVQGEPRAKAVDRGTLFTCADLPFETVVPRWFEVRDRYAAAINLLLSLRYFPQSVLETQVSTAVTAAETMHRAMDPEPSLPPEEFTLLKRTLLDAAPEHRKWLSERLGRNEPTLRARLIDLAGRPDSKAMDDLLPDRQRWAQMSTKARNDLAHTGDSNAHRLEDLDAVARVTTAVVLLNLLQDLGLTPDQQCTILADNDDLRAVVELSRKYCTTRN